MAPRLDTYEQAVYLYIFRHSRLIGLDEVVIGFKSARTRMACGIGSDGTPMSEASIYKKLASLEAKECIRIIQTEHRGQRLKLFLPREISGIVPPPETATSIDIEDMDFFGVAENRQKILEREDFRCFYTLKEIDSNSFVAEHVISRPGGGNGYRNIVAASREANNIKGNMIAEDFMRKLFREGFLSEDELRGRLVALSDLKSGRLKPVV